MEDRRQNIIKAAVDQLSKHGLAGFSQQRVAKAAGIRQSHLTYYFPTRAELLVAVARSVTDDRVPALAGSSRVKAAAGMANTVVRHPETRVMLAIAQAADEEPAIRELFRELADRVREQAGHLLVSLGLTSTHETRVLLHAVLVGLAVTDLATDRPDGKRVSQVVIEKLFALLAADGGRA